MNSKLIKRTDCRICGNKKLQKFISLGNTPLADSFVTDTTKKEETFPLDVFVCPDCNLVQLVDEVNSDLLFGEDYAFFTSSSPSSIKYFKQYADDIATRIPDKSSIVEIASNDGLLLGYLKEKGHKVLGIDPAKTVADYANSKDITTLATFFNSHSAKDIVEIDGKADLIIANNVVAHVEDLHDFMKGVKLLLSDTGVFIMEVQYFPNLLFKNQFDNIYHEHRSFFSLRPLMVLLEKYGLTAFDVEEQDTQGGSIRVFVSHKKGLPVSSNITSMLEKEKKLRLDKMETYASFENRVKNIKTELVKLLKQLKKENKLVLGYGASAKSNTMLNYCGITSDLVPYIVDKTPYKIGKFTPGSHIPVVSADHMEAQPDYYLLFVWNYLTGILEREKKFRDNGGKFIVPIPTPYII